MSPSSTGPTSQPPNRSKAWSCAAANQLLWPGLGTALAKRRIGLVQMGVSGAGGVMVVIGFIGYGARLMDFLIMNSNYQPNWRDQYALTALCGAVLFLLTWFWALFSSIGLLRNAPKQALLPPQIVGS